MEARDQVTNLFAAYVNQQTLEEAGEAMVFASEDHPAVHEQFVTAFDWALTACDRGDGAVLEAVNRSGYKVDSLPDAAGLIFEFRLVYLRAYEAAQARL